MHTEKSRAWQHVSLSPDRVPDSESRPRKPCRKLLPQTASLHVDKCDFHYSAPYMSCDSFLPVRLSVGSFMGSSSILLSNLGNMKGSSLVLPWKDWPGRSQEGCSHEVVCSRNVTQHTANCLCKESFHRRLVATVAHLWLFCMRIMNPFFFFILWSKALGKEVSIIYPHCCPWTKLLAKNCCFEGLCFVQPAAPIDLSQDLK